MNARAAMQLIELRSGREGHPSYRAVAHELHARSPRSTRPSRGDDHVDREAEPRLERILSEMRTQASGTRPAVDAHQPGRLLQARAGERF